MDAPEPTDEDEGTDEAPPAQDEDSPGLGVLDDQVLDPAEPNEPA